MPSFQDVALRDFAYYGTGGACSSLILPTTVEELARVVRGLSESKTRYFLLGGGTNSLVMDEPFDGAVIGFSRLSQLEIIGTKVMCGAGCVNTDVARGAVDAGLVGLGWMNRLPGQIGGTVRMNARCYGGEISQVATRVVAVTGSGEVKEYRDPSVFRGYKDTLFMSNGDLIGRVELTLSRGDLEAERVKMNFCEKDREDKGQFLHPTCGCVFKNDYATGVSSGMLLDRAGARGLSTNTVEVSPSHANFVYNKGATSREILELTFKMRQVVYDTYGLWMNYEMEILGDMPKDLLAEFRRVEPNRLKEDALNPLRDEFRKKTTSQPLA